MGFGGVVEEKQEMISASFSEDRIKENFIIIENCTKIINNTDNLENFFINARLLIEKATELQLASPYFDTDMQIKTKNIYGKACGKKDDLKYIVLNKAYIKLLEDIEVLSSNIEKLEHISSLKKVLEEYKKEFAGDVEKKYLLYVNLLEDMIIQYSEKVK